MAADLRISQLPPISSAALAAGDVFPVADLSASETKSITVYELAQASFLLIPDGRIPGAKLATDSVTALQLGPGAVGANELASAAVSTGSLQDGAVTNDKVATGINATKLSPGTAAITVFRPGSFDRGLDSNTGALGHTNAITPGTVNGITFDSAGHITAAAPLTSANLPNATTNSIGAVSVPASGGLVVSGAGALAHNNAVAPGSVSGISYNAHGHITSARALSAADLPLATTTDIGGVHVPADSELGLDSAGRLFHSTSTVAPGTYPKVTINRFGHVTAGTSLEAADIPAISADKITSGYLTIDRLAGRSITADLIADYTITLIQEASPSTGPHPIGRQWIQESTGQVSVWNGNSWIRTAGSLIYNRNLRYCGTFNATNAQVIGLTQFGQADGFAAGVTLPTADDRLAGAYFVCAVGGSTGGLAGGALFDAGDWVLCQGALGGWVRVDTLSGGGGGGGATSLNDLLDVTVSATPAVGALLGFNTSTGQWVDVTSISGGTY